MQNSLFKLFENVCTHPSYNDKNPPSVFFFKFLFLLCVKNIYFLIIIIILKSPLSNQAVLRFLSE